MLHCRDLGPLVVELDGVTVDVGGRVPHRLLTALACADGAAVPDDVLAEQVWGDSLPVAVPPSLRVVVSRLRTALGPAGRRFIDRTANGYALIGGRTDHAVFTELVEQALTQQPAERLPTLLTALDLWRGNPWPELAESVSATGGRSRLVELRQVAVEELAAARLALGATTDAITLLTEAVAEAPFRERRWELLALGLYRSGRQAQALAELRKVRGLLVDELGVEPGPALRELERRMLDHDPGLLLIDPAVRSAASAPRSRTTPSHEISGPASPLIGRTGELRVLDDLMSRERLVTLVGPAGVGKTRLAIEYAVQSDGLDIRPVRLADIQESNDVVNTVAASVAGTLGVSRGGAEPIDAITRALGDRSCLLLLDNCEHIVDAVGELVLALMPSCPDLRILSTSREALGLDGEHVLPVEPLAVVDARGADGPAVQLLLDKATAARAGWSPSAADRESARRICTSLDGLPLAIELAAARERAFGLAEIAERLHDRVDVLGSTPRGSTSPHASLAAAIQWSIEQLDDTERGFLLRLWPFEGGFDWQAAEAVQSRPGATLSMLAGLFGRSVLTVDRSDGTTRYRMLETIRRHCRDLDTDPAATLEAHARWVRTYVADRSWQRVGPRAGEIGRGMALERANIVAGITHDLTHAPAAALATATDMSWAWLSLGAWTEAVRLIRAALDAAPEAPLVRRAAGILTLGIGRLHVGDPEGALQRMAVLPGLLTGSTPAVRELRQRVLVNQAVAAAESGDLETTDLVAKQLHVEAADERTDDWVRCASLQVDATCALMRGQIDDGIALIKTAIERSEECGYVMGTAASALYLAWANLSAARPTDAVSWALAAATIYRDQWCVADAMYSMYAGIVALPGLIPANTAVTLYAALDHQAARLGLDASRHKVYRLSVARQIEALADDPQHLDAVRQGQALTWPETYSLFERTAQAVGTA
ncbi:BTAD domain-containing putative transcriptional regulator [Kribbella sp. NPDC056951]|uniref:BTAD domain-containing putative transcriptional regulator n=1 Tax=Kribbella sp. NPDC056951 TaxID=3345978 RepID=UPI00363BB4EB